jgi:thiol-disulfide isomerase/thioredoxin
MRRLVAVLWLSALSLAAWQTAPADIEEQELRRTLAEAGSSGIDMVRTLEAHLAKYPKTARRAEIERALVSAAMEMNDRERVIRYGERVLEREPDDLQLMERVARSLLVASDKEPSEKALALARRYEAGIRKVEKEKLPGLQRNLGQLRDEIDRGLGRAYVLEARATGNLGRIDEALALARKSYQAFPTAESAREIGRWLAKSGKEEEAAAHYADAFMIPDPRTRDADRALDRARMGELWLKAKGSEQGLGELLLAAYDRTVTLVKERELRLQQLDPNSKASKVADFTLSGLADRKLALSSLTGKVVVMDFWATWCGPCRAQHPLYEQVKQSFKGEPVAFLSISADDDRSLVPGFLKENNWDTTVYFDDGILAALRISSIPVAILLNKRGEVSSRLDFIPGRFVDMLTDRIRKALSE